THVVLPFEAGAWAAREVAALAAEAPEHPPGATVDLVCGPGVSGRGHEVAVGCDVDRVDVEVVEARPGPGLDLGLGDRDVVEAVPLPEEAAARQRELLYDAADDAAAAAAADASEVPRPHLVARHESGSLRRDHELVQVAVQPARRPEAGQLP